MRKGIIVGLTGQTGAGKSTVAELLSHYNYKILSADQTAALVTSKGSPTLPKLADAFGDDILLDDGSLNRPALAAKAFSDPEQLKKLNSITHPEICRLLMKKAEGAFFDGYDVAVLDASQLFESGLDEKCTLVISVTAPEADRLRRICKRDQLTEEQALQRMHAQLSEDFFREHSDIILENKSNETYLHTLVGKAADYIELACEGKFPTTEAQEN